MDHLASQGGRGTNQIVDFGVAGCRTVWPVERMRPLAGPSSRRMSRASLRSSGFPTKDQGPVVQEPDVAGEVEDPLGDEVDQGLEDEGEEQGGQGVPLVEAQLAGEGGVAKEEVTWLPITNFDPG